ncbi:hypothetical protein CKA32_002435 [Geitlerinema sp. FC II]|nr:hypothetical protein CKA32_002435 [Geitlerinema sp. FC II]
MRSLLSVRASQNSLSAVLTVVATDFISNGAEMRQGRCKWEAIERDVSGEGFGQT